MPWTITPGTEIRALLAPLLFKLQYVNIWMNMVTSEQWAHFGSLPRSAEADDVT
jgi:hypothetical protein